MSQQTTTNGLKTHIESKHEGVRYPCDECEFASTTKSDLIAILCPWVVPPKAVCSNLVKSDFFKTNRALADGLGASHGPLLRLRDFQGSLAGLGVSHRPLPGLGGSQGPLLGLGGSY